jgi:hypothetical protein
MATKKFVAKNGIRSANVEFKDSDASLNSIIMEMLSTDTLSFSGDAGQLFSITDTLDGTIYSVNDVSGMPSIEVDDDGTIRLAEYSGNVLIGSDSDDGATALQVTGNIKGTLLGNASTATEANNADTLDGQHGTHYRINVYNSSGTLLN